MTTTTSALESLRILELARELFVDAVRTEGLRLSNAPDAACIASKSIEIAREFERLAEGADSAELGSIRCPLWGDVGVSDPYQRTVAFPGWVVEVSHHNRSGAICLVRAARDMEAMAAAQHVASALRSYDKALGGRMETEFTTNNGGVA